VKIWRKLTNWMAFVLERRADRRCARGQHGWRRRDSTFHEFVFTPYYDYGSCPHCGVSLRKPRLFS
jgi:hypothetical protein